MDVHGYCVRVDALDGYSDKIKMLSVVADYDSFIAVAHQGSTKENPHYHLVVRTKVKDQAFRVRMKKVFDKGKGNGHMSIKPWDGCNDAVAYLFHEDDNATIVARRGVSDETITEAKQRNQQVQREIAKAKDRASWRLEEEVFESVRRRSFRPHEDSTDTIAKEIILLALRSGRYMPNDYLLKSMVTRIQFKLLNGDVAAEEAFAEAHVQRIFHRFG